MILESRRAVFYVGGGVVSVRRLRANCASWLN